MKKLYMFILSIFLMSACSSKHFIKNDETSFNVVNQNLKGKNVTLTLNNGEEISSSNVYIKSDSTMVDEIFIPTININKIEDENHLLGAVNGAVVGVIVGTGTGFFYDYVNNIDVSVGYNIFDHSWDASASTQSNGRSAVIGGVLGFCVGALVGGLNGPTDTFIFIQPDTLD